MFLLYVVALCLFGNLGTSTYASAPRRPDRAQYFLLIQSSVRSSRPKTRIVHRTMTWDGAQAHCQQFYGGKLATTGFDQHDVQPLAISWTVDSTKWSQDILNMTSDDHKATLYRPCVTYHYPQNATDCGVFRATYCQDSSTRAFLCELPQTKEEALPKPPYLYIRSQTPWLEAERECNKIGRHLASIHNPTDFYAVEKMRPADERIWLGARYICSEKTMSAEYTCWVWSDGSTFDYSVFQRPFQPDYDYELCLELVGWELQIGMQRQGSAWNNIGCCRGRQWVSGYVCGPEVGSNGDPIKTFVPANVERYSCGSGPDVPQDGDPKLNLACPESITKMDYRELSLRLEYLEKLLDRTLSSQKGLLFFVIILQAINIFFMGLGFGLSEVGKSMNWLPEFTW